MSLSLSLSVQTADGSLSRSLSLPQCLEAGVVFSFGDGSPRVGGI